MRFAESTTHSEDSELNAEFISALRVADDFAGVFALFGKLAIYFRERICAEVEGGRVAFEVVVRVAQEREMSAILLKINTVRVDDGDGFARVGEDFAVQISAQFYWSRSRLSLDFRGRHKNNFRRGN